MTYKVAIIILTFNAERWIISCLESIGQSKYPVETIVVENCSTDQTQSLLNNFPFITKFIQEENTGFGIGNNIGIFHALHQKQADYVFLLNQDARIQPDTIEILLNYAQEHPEYGIISPLHLNDDGSALDPLFAKHITRIAWPERAHLLSAFYRQEYDQVFPLRFVNAAAWLVSRQCLEDVGGFDPLFFPAYGEDDDYCNRVRFHGYRIGLVPSATIFHSRGKSSQPQSPTQTSPISSPQFAVIKEANDLTRKLKILSSPILYLLFIHLGAHLRRIIGKVRGKDFRQAAILIRALMKVLYALPTIIRHRQISKQKGSHWITESGR